MLDGGIWTEERSQSVYLKTTDEYLKERRWKLQKTIAGKGLRMLRSRLEDRRIFWEYSTKERKGTRLQRAGWAFPRAWTGLLPIIMIKYYFLWLVIILLRL